MDKTTLFVTIGGWVVTLAVCILENYSNRRKLDVEQARHLTEINHTQDLHAAEVKGYFEKEIAVISTQIKDLTNKVEKHNSVVERTFKLESDMAVVNEKVKVANNRISDLEKGDKK